MRITDLLAPEAVEFGVSVASKSEAIDKLISLHEGAGNLRDVEAYREAILAREAGGTTAIGEGMAIPHAKTDAVANPALAAITVPDGVDYEAPAAEAAAAAAAPAAEADGDGRIHVLGVTACPTGIAHTYLGLEREDNPFMGFRAIRYCLAREDVYRTQLRALLRASAFGEIRIMVPLVTCVDELTSVKTLVRRYMQEFDQEGVAYNPDIQIGVMVETPAASLIADLLAEEADFFSIETNDLTGYTMCADRGNDKVRYLYSTYNPAVLRSIRHVIEAGNSAGITVGMCGEAAADPTLIPLWIAFGLGEYSVSATSVLSTRKHISLWTKEEACALADEVMQLKTAAEVYDALQESMR